MRVILGILMVIAGVLGLLATACGLFFVGSAPVEAVILGLVPGALLLLLTAGIWKELRRSQPLGQGRHSDPGPTDNP